MAAPNPLDPGSYAHRFVRVASGRRYHLVDQPPAHWRGPVEQAPTVLLAHGFPDLWYGWRYQIAAFAARGWRVLCPTQLGYGDSDKPVDLEAYGHKSVAYDMNSLLDECRAKRVVVVGHDWGGMVAWRLVDYFPHRVISVASVCTPYMPPAQPSTPYTPAEEWVRTKLPNFGYQLFFQKETSAAKIERVLPQFFAGNFSQATRADASRKAREAVQEGVMERIVDAMIESQRQGKQLKTPPSEPEFDYYLSTFRRTGLHSALNWYRTRLINHCDEQASQIPPFPEHIPALVLPAENDLALPPSMAESPAVRKCFPGGNLEVRVVRGADHWLLQDPRYRAQVTRLLADFVEESFAKEEAGPLAKL
ncbi:hypothetical protein JCM21900_000731 [Sporobolomyces salmonicolor]